MKTIITVIMIISAILTTACDNAGYMAREVGDTDQQIIYVQDTEAEQALTECLDGAEAEAINYEKKIAELSEPVEYAQTNWELKYNSCAESVLELQALAGVAEKQNHVLYTQVTELRESLRYLDVNRACIDGIIKTDWICKAAATGDL